MPNDITTPDITIQAVIQEHRNEARRLSSLLRIYPDLTSGLISKKRRFLSSKAINAKATEYEVVTSCSCCPDPELFVKIFVQTEHGRVYGFPVLMKIGERDEGVDYLDTGWEQDLAERGVRPLIIDRLRAHFAEKPEPEDG